MTLRRKEMPEAVPGMSDADQEAAFRSGFKGGGEAMAGEPTQAAEPPTEPPTEPPAEQPAGVPAGEQAVPESPPPELPPSIDTEKVVIALVHHVKALTEQVARLEQGEAEEQAEPESPLAGEVGPELEKIITEHINDMLGKRLSEMSSAMSAAITQAFSAMRDDIHGKMLEMHHPGWLDEVNGAQFNKWVASLPKEESAKVRAEASPDGMLKHLRNFREHSNGGSGKESKDDRLARAIPPRGDGRLEVPISDDEAFSAGFKGSMRSR